MQRLFSEKVVALVAENAARARASLPELCVADAGLAGGGDGHTFVLALLLTTDEPVAGWLPADVPSVVGVFWVGGEAEALGDYQEAAIAQLKAAASSALTKVIVGHAGGADQRFMGFIAAVAT